MSRPECRLKKLKLPTLILTWSLSPALCASQLEDAVFYCSDVPDCTVSCGGPNKELIRTVTEQCGCMIEWLTHAAFVKFSIAFCIYALMNISRIILVQALCKLWWEWLSPKVFSYKSTCNSKGQILAPAKAVGVSSCLSSPTPTTTITPSISPRIGPISEVHGQRRSSQGRAGRDLGEMGALRVDRADLRGMLEYTVDCVSVPGQPFTHVQSECAELTTCFMYT